MNKTGNDIENRNKSVYFSKTFERIANIHDLKNKKVLDMGCGYGEYMQRFGDDSTGITTTPDEVTYGESKGIDIRFGNVERLDETLNRATDTYDFFWANNLFEHLLSPHAFLVNLKKFSKPDSKIILGVPMVPLFPTLMHINKFRGALASPHINFFTKDTFKLTIEYAGWTILDVRSYFFSNSILDHATTRLAPHLYITAQNNDQYQYPEKKIREWENDPYCASLIKTVHEKI